jgi:hypothetical protein
MDDSRIKDVSSLLRAFFNEDRLRKGGEYVRFFSAWADIVGERDAAHSRIRDIDRGILLVEVEHPGWIQLLQLRQHDILAAAQARFPELGLRGIAFRLGGEAWEPVSTGDKRGRPGPFGPDNASIPAANDEEEPSPHEKTHVSLDTIQDQELKSRLASLKKVIEGGESG